MTESVLTQYSAAADRYDEMLIPGGETREHWSYLSDSLERLGLEELLHRQDEIHRLLAESGVTYNVYDQEGEPSGVAGERPWSLDPIPNLIPSSEWSELERGLTQRAVLLDLILRDLYGPREILRKGLLPPEVVFAHGGFLRACQGITRGGRFLYIYAVDLGRLPSGEFVVIGDRAQAPSGSGYALENRVVLSRVLPSLFRDCQVHRLALYFRALREALVEAAGTEDPRIVLLTPGPRNETFFEHAFLAGYLGYPLVQGGDLSVREGQVWFNTLDGRRRVDAILRRLDDDFADPLELRPDSVLGVPGLLEAARMGRIAVLNPPGSGLLENPGLLPYLPGLCRALLGEDLRLPSAPTLWCGDPEQFGRVQDRPEDYHIEPISPAAGLRAFHPGRMAAARREDLLRRVKARPHEFVARPSLPLSTLPTLTDGRVEPRPMILRTYLVARDSDYLMMPGGLTRVARGLDSDTVSGQQGGISKDTWVIASEPRREVTLLSSEPAAVFQRGGADVARHAAEHLFWLGRYCERAEITLRLQREIFQQMGDTGERLRPATLPTLLFALTNLTTAYPGFRPEDEELVKRPEIELLDLVYNVERPGTLAFNLRAALNCGRDVQDLLAEDAWRILNSLRKLPERGHTGRVLEDLQNILMRLAAFGRMADESMVRVVSFHMFDMGRRLERALNSLALVGSIWSSAERRDGWLLERLLSVQMSLRTFRWRYPASMGEDTVLDILLLDETNPRSVAFQLAALEEITGRLPGKKSALRTREEKLILEALSLLRLADPVLLAEKDHDEPSSLALEGLVGRVNRLLRELSDALHANYLSSTELPRMLIERG